jgi:hypothetical protein
MYDMQLLDSVMQRISNRIGIQHMPRHTEPQVLATGASLLAGVLGEWRSRHWQGMLQHLAHYELLHQSHVAHNVLLHLIPSLPGVPLQLLSFLGLL